MMRALKDSYWLSLVVAIAFFVSILISAYFLYSIPHSLMVSGAQPVFIKAFITVGISFLLGAGSIYIALQSQREVVVYKDRVIDEAKAALSASEESRTTITLDGVRASLNQSKDDDEVLKSLLNTICKQLEAGQGALYRTTVSDGTSKIDLKTGYALNFGENATVSFAFGEGLVGQCALNKRTLYVDDIPEGYVKIISGLGSASPRYLLVVPILKDQNVEGVIEIATFAALSEDQRQFVEEAAKLLSEKIK